jgi:2'-5' RNA ligase
MRDHWWWRPGWAPGRRFWTFHVTWRDQPQVQELAAKARERLASTPGLDLVPGQWLHCTTQGVGFDGEVSAADLSAIAAAARTRLASVRPARVELTAPGAVAEGVACWVGLAGGLNPLRDALREAIGDVWGADRVPEDAQWSPHVSLAYANADGQPGPVDAVLEGLCGVTAVVRSVELIRLGRDQHLYEWDSAEALPLGVPPAD